MFMISRRRRDPGL